MFCGKCGNQIPDGVSFCPFCGEKLIDAAAQAAAPVVEEVQNAATPVVEAAAPVAEAAAPVPEAPVQQPVYQQAPVEQPVYQQPAQPVYQQPVYQQPVYQQPVYQQPVYQQPVFQTPLAPAPKKKSKAGLIIIIILVLLILAAGGLFACANLMSEEDVPEVFSFMRINKGSELALSEKEQKTFTKIVKNMDQAIIDADGSAYAECIPAYAQNFVWSVYGETSADSFVKYLYGDKDNGISKLGDDIKVTEEIVTVKKISKTEDLKEAFEEIFKKSIDFERAYLVTNNSCFKGDEGSQKYVDYYLFFLEEDEEDWSVILIGEDNLEKFNLKK